MSDAIPALISGLINRGKFTEAMELGEEFRDDPEVTLSSHFWAQWAIARTGAGLDGTPQYMRALLCDDITPTMRGDVLRDLALVVARLGSYDEALSYLDAAREYCENDLNRQAAIYMTYGRIAALKGDAKLAVAYHEFAHELWQLAGTEADPQWIMNNRFYWMREKALLELPRRVLYQEFKASPEQRSDRKAWARAFYYAGPAAAFANLASEVAANARLQVRTQLEYMFESLDMGNLVNS